MIAKYYQRGMAFFIDLTLSTFTAIISFFTFKLSGIKIEIGFIEILFFYYFILSILSIFYTKNRTIGERFLGIRILQIKSKALAKASKSLIRFLIKFLVLLNIYFNPVLGLILLVIFLYWGFIQPYSKNKQFLWDIITKTSVYVYKDEE